MNASTGEITVWLDDVEEEGNRQAYQDFLTNSAALAQKRQVKPLIPLTEEEYCFLKNQDKGARKNHMRNKACPCGSDRKFKKCCWNKFT